jgi:hypothetical protein
MVEEQVLKSRKVVRCQSCVSFTRMNKQVLLSRNRAASILKKTSPQLILLKEGTYNGQKFKLYRVEVEYDIANCGEESPLAKKIGMIVGKGLKDLKKSASTC